jgi:hypothetical protein
VEIMFLERERDTVSVMHSRTMALKIFLQGPQVGFSDFRGPHGDKVITFTVGSSRKALDFEQPT